MTSRLPGAPFLARASRRLGVNTDTGWQSARSRGRRRGRCRRVTTPREVRRDQALVGSMPSSDAESWSKFVGLMELKEKGENCRPSFSGLAAEM